MASSYPPNGPGINRLLARLPQSDSERLLPHLQHVPLKFKQTLYDARSAIGHIYFPTRGVVSLMTVMADGAAIEVATIGFEGLVGLNAVFGDATSPNQVLVQVEGDGLRLPAAVLREEFQRGGALRDLLLRYHTAFQTQVSQSVACNGLHAIQQRCCRWLLLTQDRLQSDELHLTHEFLAVMLGVRRPSVTEVLGALQERGLVQPRRGMIEILDRAGLEALACECYRVVAAEFERLFP